jgi:hypothetical protein
LPLPPHNKSPTQKSVAAAVATALHDNLGGADSCSARGTPHRHVQTRGATKVRSSPMLVQQSTIGPELSLAATESCESVVPEPEPEPLSVHKTSVKSASKKRRRVYLPHFVNDADTRNPNISVASRFTGEKFTVN